MSFATSTVEPACQSAVADSNLSAPPAPAQVASPIRVVLLLTLALGAGLTVKNWLQAAAQMSWTGTLQARTTQVVAPYDARIERIVRSAGDSVAPGDELLRLESQAVAAELAVARRKVNELELQRNQALATADVEIGWRLKSVDDDIHETRLKAADLHKERYFAELSQVAWRDFLRARPEIETAAAASTPLSLFELPLPDEARIRAMLQQEAAHNASEVFRAQVELCEERLTDLQSLRTTLPEQIRGSVGVPLLEAQLTQAQAEVARLQSQLDDVLIVSPAYGVIGVYRRNQGDSIAAGEPIVDLLDRAQQYLELRIPSRQLDRFPVGAPLRLTFPGGVQREGIVGPHPPQTEAVGAAEETLLALSIQPTGKTWPEVPFGTNVVVSLGKK